MRKLIVEEWLSLDGHVTDKNGKLDFFIQVSPEQNTHSDRDHLKFMETIDTILLGRKTYELFVDFWPRATTKEEVIADKINQTKKIVFSSTLASAPWGNWPPAEIINRDAVTVIRDLKSLPGKNMVLWGSISLVQALMHENLIDEYHLQLCPVVTGGGRKFFTGKMLQLRLSATKHYPSGIVFLNYRPTV